MYTACSELGTVLASEFVEMEKRRTNSKPFQKLLLGRIAKVKTAKG